MEDEILEIHDDVDNTAIYVEIHEAENATATSLPFKRLKDHHHSIDLGGNQFIQRLVLALDSSIENHVSWAIKQLTILSFKHFPNKENILSLEKNIILLDAMYRQLQMYSFLDNFENKNIREKLLNLGTESNHFFSCNYLLKEKILQVLNIIRNLTMIPINEKIIGSHFPIMSLLFSYLNVQNEEISGYSFDIIASTCCHITENEKKTNYIANKIFHDTLTSTFNKLKMDEHLNKHSILSYINPFLHSTNKPKVYQSLEIIKYLACSKSNEIIFQEASDNFYRRLIELLCFSKSGETKLEMSNEIEIEIEINDIKKVDNINSIGKVNNSMDDTSYNSLNNTFGINMGTVFGPRSGSSNSYISDETIDHEIRDITIDTVYYISCFGNFIKMRIASQPKCLERLATIISSQVGKPEAKRIAIGILANLSLNKDTFRYFSNIEKQIALAVFSNMEITDLLSTIVSNVYGPNLS